jgi:hypothetical protein
VNVVNETRNQTYQRLSKIGAKVGISEEKMFELLKIADKPAEDGSLNTEFTSRQLWYSMVLWKMALARAFPASNGRNGWKRMSLDSKKVGTMELREEQSCEKRTH